VVIHPVKMLNKMVMILPVQFIIVFKAVKKRINAEEAEVNASINLPNNNSDTYLHQSIKKINKNPKTSNVILREQSFLLFLPSNKKR